MFHSLSVVKVEIARSGESSIFRVEMHGQWEDLSYFCFGMAYLEKAEIDSAYFLMEHFVNLIKQKHPNIL